MNFQKGVIVTLDQGQTFIIDTDEGDTVLLTHPLSPEILVRALKSKVNTTSASVKDTSERGLDFANNHKDNLDFDTKKDLEGLSIVYMVRRKLTPRQKATLATICGNLAKIQFNNDVRAAGSFIVTNESLLDDFNRMWYRNLFNIMIGRAELRSKKQSETIFNIAGYALSRLYNPIAKTHK